RMQDPQIGRWHVVDNYSEVYFALSPYNYGGNDPANTIDIDGNLFIFANGFMVNQYGNGIGQNKTVTRSSEWNHRFRGGGVPTKWEKSPNSNYYAPDRGFYEDGPRNNGARIENYWK